jgi:hypothetical protein
MIMLKLFGEIAWFYAAVTFYYKKRRDPAGWSSAVVNPYRWHSLPMHQRCSMHDFLHYITIEIVVRQLIGLSESVHGRLIGGQTAAVLQALNKSRLLHHQLLFSGRLFVAQQGCHMWHTLYLAVTAVMWVCTAVIGSFCSRHTVAVKVTLGLCTPTINSTGSGK